MQGMPSPPKLSFGTLREILGQTWEVSDVDLSEGEVAGDVDVLLVVDPRDLEEPQVRAIDQFLMRGGSVIVAGGTRVLETQPFGGGIGVAAVTTGLDPDGATALEITEGDTTLRLDRKGDAWLVADAHDYPADASKVEQALRDLSAAEVSDRVAQTASSHRKLEVDAEHNKRRVAVTAPSGRSTVFLGGSGRAGTTYARVDGEDDVVAVRDLSPWRFGSKATSWIDRNFWQVDQEQVRTVELENELGRLSLRRLGEGWVVLQGDQERPADSAVVDKLLGRALRLSLTDVAGRLEGAPKASVTLSIGIAEAGDDDSAEPEVAETRSLHLGAEEDAWLAWTDGSDHVVRVATSSIQPVLDATFTGLAGR